MNAELQVDNKAVLDLLGQVARRINDMTPVMRQIAATMADAVEENFARQGRPTQWKQSNRAKEQGGMTLQDRGILAASIHAFHSSNEAGVATKDKRARVLHFGAKKGSFGTFAHKVKSHSRNITQAFGRPLAQPVGVTVREHTRTVKLPWGDIPARPFMMIQDEDWNEIQGELGGYLVGERATD
jgi:phage gpG-like protein